MEIREIQLTSKKRKHAGVKNVDILLSSLSDITMCCPIAGYRTSHFSSTDVNTEGMGQYVVTCSSDVIYLTALCIFYIS